MKIILSILLIMLFPSVILAHGGVEKSLGNITISLDQIPLSPVVGEKVFMTFYLNGRDNISIPLKNYNAQVVIKETYPENVLDGIIIATQELKTDERGVIQFGYTFEKEAYFDVDLNLLDPISGVRHEIGFLVQVRPITASSSNIETKNENSINWLHISFASVAGIIGGLILSRIIRK